MHHWYNEQILLKFKFIDKNFIDEITKMQQWFNIRVLKVTTFRNNINVYIYKLCRAHEMICRAHEIISRVHEIISRKHEIICRKHEIICRKHEIISRAHDKIFSKKKIECPYRLVLRNEKKKNNSLWQVNYIVMSN